MADRLPNGCFAKGNKFSAGENHAGGPVSLYKEEYCQKLEDFFNVPPQTVAYKKETKRDGTVTETPMLLGAELPTFERFAVTVCGITPATLCKWVNEYPDFKESHDRAKALQKSILYINGLSGQYNAQVVKLIGMNDHGMTEKTEASSTTQLDVKIVYNYGDDKPKLDAEKKAEIGVGEF